MGVREIVVSKEFERIVESLKEKGEAGPLRISGLRVSSRAFVLSRLFLELNRSLIIFSVGDKEAEDMAGDLGFFLGSSSGSGSSGAIYVLPSYGVPLYHENPPPPEVIHQRLSCLLALVSTDRPIIVCAGVEAVLRKTIPHDVFLSSVHRLDQGRKVNMESLVRRISEGGYTRVNTVEIRGEYAVRGGIMDIFPSSSSSPCRLEFSGDEVVSLRTFDPSTQRSTDVIREILVPPAREVLLNEETLACMEDSLKALTDELDIPRRKRDELLEDLRSPEGQENFLPLFYSRPGTLFEYLPSRSLITLDDPGKIDTQIDDLWELAEERHEKVVAQKPLPPPKSFFLPPQGFRSSTEKLQRIALDPLGGVSGTGIEIQVSLPTAGGGPSKIRAESILDRFAAQVKEWMDSGLRVFFVSQATERLQRLFEEHYLRLLPSQEPFTMHWKLPEFSPQPVVLKGEISSGFVLPSEGLVVISEDDIFGPRRKLPRPLPSPRPYLSYADLREGDFVVHTAYGIGLYKGLQHLSTGGVDGDYLHLEYAEGDRLYLPLSLIHI
mgnify:CR=1 FL=1